MQHFIVKSASDGSTVTLALALERKMEINGFGSGFLTKTALATKFIILNSSLMRIFQDKAKLWEAFERSHLALKEKDCKQLTRKIWTSS